MVRNLNPAEMTGGVPAETAAPAGVPQVAPAPVETQVQVQPTVNPLEQQVATLQGQIQAMSQFISGLQKPQAQAAPQAPAVPQPTFREKVKALGDPVSSADPSAWLESMAETFESEMQARLSGLQTQLQPQFQTLEQITQEREIARQQGQFISAFKQANPEFVSVPDQVIAQQVQAFNTDPSLFMKALASHLGGLVKPPVQAQPQTIPPTQVPQPSAAATVPTGVPGQNIAQMQADFIAWNGNPMAAQNAKLSRPDYFSQVHAAAVANKWKQ